MKMDAWRLISVVGSKLLELPLHRIDSGDVCRHEMISASLRSPHLEATARVCGGRASATEMDKGGKILPLLLVGRLVTGPSKDVSQISVQVYRCQLDGMAGYDADIEAEATTRIFN